MEFSSSQDKPWFLLGIVSFGPKWCGIGHPGVYTRWGLDRKYWVTLATFTLCPVMDCHSEE